MPDAVGGLYIGKGGGNGFGSRGKAVPRLRQAEVTVSGPMDRDTIRRIVRAHINEVRHCYNQVLVADPKVGGRVTIRFEIDGTGKVPSATVVRTIFAASDPSECIAKDG